MTDRELLELAAKACGELTPSWYGNSDYMDGVLSRWNPLTDDGDALRLAVKLGLRARYDRRLSIAWVEEPFTEVRCDDAVNFDEYATARRAIVRAAASIGEQMK